MRPQVRVLSSRQRNKILIDRNYDNNSTIPATTN
jgi:hypothetical protein